ncbi:TPA: hypothetical protein ACSA7R_005242, partial [Escherichia coli]
MNKVNKAVLLSVAISALLIFVNTVLYMEVDEMVIPQSTYLMVIIALFLLMLLRLCLCKWTLHLIKN